MPFHSFNFFFHFPTLRASFQFCSALIFPPHPSMCNCGISSQFWQTRLSIFFPHLQSYFWPRTLTSLNPTTTHPTIMFFPSFLLYVMFFLQSFASSFTEPCIFQCSEVMVEYNKKKKKEQFVPFALSRDRCNQGCDLQTHKPNTHAHTKTEQWWWGHFHSHLLILI